MLSTLGPVAQLLQLGFVMVTPILIGIALGLWLDRQLGTAPWFVLAGLLLGLGLGGYSVFKLINRVFGSGERRRE